MGEAQKFEGKSFNNDTDKTLDPVDSNLELPENVKIYEGQEFDIEDELDKPISDKEYPKPTDSNSVKGIRDLKTFLKKDNVPCNDKDNEKEVDKSDQIPKEIDFENTGDVKEEEENVKESRVSKNF